MVTAAEAWDASLDRRALGAYFTPAPAAGWMVDWALPQGGESVLEPSFGNGAFLAALRSAGHTNLIGAEIDSSAHRQAVDAGLVDSASAHRGDFLAMSRRPVGAVVGNPPYVRLRHLPAAQRARALAVAEQSLGTPMDPSGSVWMPFVLHATGFLRPGGRLALVLPYELTYVRYARPLWRHLAGNFGELHVVRVRQRLFPDLFQDTVLLLAARRGGSTTTVGYRTFETVNDLLTDRPATSRSVDVNDVVEGERPFLRALLDQSLLNLLDQRLPALTRPVRDTMRVRIGYVSGDKAFFHPGPATREQHGLTGQSLRPALPASRDLVGCGLWTSSVEAPSRLFHPSEPLSAADRDYIRCGETTGVTERYKCRSRFPWWLVPGVQVPDVVLSVFSERPVLLVNDGGLVASNSLLCGYAEPGVDPGSFAAAWYTSLTLLQLELEVHSLGGGVFVLVPGEVGRLRLPAMPDEGDRAAPLTRIDRMLAGGDLSGAYRSGDGPILRDRLGLTDDHLHAIHDGITTLAGWRRAGGPRGGQGSAVG